MFAHTTHCRLSLIANAIRTSATPHKLVLLQVRGAEQAIRLCAMATRGGNHGEICVHVGTRPHMAEAYAQPHGWPATRLLSLLLH